MVSSQEERESRNVQPRKLEVVRAIRAEYGQVAEKGCLVFADYRGLTVGELFKVRTELREKAASLKVLKNTLVRRALEESGVDGTRELLAGPTAVVFSPDEVSAAKVLAKLAKEFNRDDRKGGLFIKGGVLDGKPVDASVIEELSKLPGREELFAKLLATINAPATQLLRTIQEPGAMVARLLSAKSEKES